MGTVNRRWTVRLYPRARQAAAMEEACARHCELYNAALEHRIDAWKRARKTVSFVEQAALLREVKDVRSEYQAITHDTLNATLKRLDLAMQAFFRRVKAGEIAGFPRFKSRRRYAGWQYLAHGKGNKVTPRCVEVDGCAAWSGGTLYMQHIGKVRMRGVARTMGEIKTVTILRKAGRWYASIVVACTPYREHGEGRVGLDWGVESLLTLAEGPGRYKGVINERLFRKQQEQAAEAARQASKSLRGRRSRTAARKHVRVARLHQKLADQRKWRTHEVSADLVAQNKVIVTEDHGHKNMTRSAKGTVQKPGKNVAPKRGLNREILDTAPAALMAAIRYKAEEAGARFIAIKTRKHKPSQTCPCCGVVRKKKLAERVHRCPCGFVAGRDQAAALHILSVGLETLGQKLTWAKRPKTPSRAASAA